MSTRAELQKSAEAFQLANDLKTAAEQWVLLGALLEKEKSEEEALNAYQNALLCDPLHREALYALGLILHKQEAWDELLSLYEKRRTHSKDAGERSTLHMYSAEILEERLQKPEAAFQELLSAVRNSPENIRILSRLTALGTRLGRLSEIAVVIGELLLHQDDKRVRAALSFRLAELYMGPLKDETRALAYLRSALLEDGGRPEILREAADSFREQSRFDALCQVLSEVSHERRNGPHVARLHRELARIYEYELKEPVRALEAVSRAVVEVPHDRESVDELLRLLKQTGRKDLVTDAVRAILDSEQKVLLATYFKKKWRDQFGEDL